MHYLRHFEPFVVNIVIINSLAIKSYFYIDDQQYVFSEELNHS